MKLRDEKEYWDDNFKLTSPANELLFSWFADIRHNLFNVNEDLFSLEIGPGVGSFTKIAKVNVVVDFSLVALLKIKKEYDCLLVVANASYLPFKKCCFKIVYANDLMHHLKAQGILEDSCNEIKRVLGAKGFFCISDRLPGFYNYLQVKFIKIPRSLLLIFMKIFKRKFLLSGSNNEISMNVDDYSIIYKNMDVVAEKKWKTWIVVWLYAIQQFVNLITPASAQVKLSKVFINLCKSVERKFSDRYKTDICITLMKDINVLAK